jgi:hypothetical protein
MESQRSILSLQRQRCLKFFKEFARTQEGLGECIFILNFKQYFSKIFLNLFIIIEKVKKINK